MYDIPNSGVGGSSDERLRILWVPRARGQLENMAAVKRPLDSRSNAEATNSRSVLHVANIHVTFDESGPASQLKPSNLY